METAILLAVAASLCTATSSVCQRMGAKSSQTTGFDAGLVFRLARRPVWLLGIASMILGFVLQLIALHFGALALVQPILAGELVFVFGYLAVAGSGRVTRRDWLAAAAMSAGIGVFLRVASPSGGRLHAPGSSWLVAGLVTVGVVLLALAVAFGLGRRPGASGPRRAAVLGAATGISWGFMAAVIKELSSHLGGGAGAIFSSWSLYLLIAAGAATMLLASHALAAGPLAASQPGFTILDPLAASLLGMFLFGEHIRTGAADLAGEALALAAVIAAAAVLSHSCHLAGENRHPSYLVTPTLNSAANSPSAAAGRRAARAEGAGGVLPGARLSNRAGTAPTTWPRHRPGSTSPARVRCSRPRSPAAASGTTTRPSLRRAAGLPRCRPSRARSRPGTSSGGNPSRPQRPARRSGIPTTRPSRPMRSTCREPGRLAALAGRP
jgi:drug/metabolite transporter (DMT)-like permease